MKMENFIIAYYFGYGMQSLRVLQGKRQFGWPKKVRFIVIFVGLKYDDITLVA